jgi:hypothetical protein
MASMIIPERIGISMAWNEDNEIMVTALSEGGTASLGGFRAGVGDVWQGWGMTVA